MKSKKMNKNSYSSSIHHHHPVKTSTPSSANTFPFPTDESDHCETPKEAFQDLAALLDAVATKLQKSRADLKIYDPYYCAGRSARTLGLLGFDNVYNRCEDFYKMIETNSTPEFDVVVTNPPFSGDHMERIIQWAASTGKPFFLLMPNFVYTKPYYADACGDKQPRLLVPLARGRYKFLPPAWVSAAEGSTSIAKGKTATSPFLAFWYCWAEHIDAAGASCGSLHVVLTPPRREEDFYKNQGLLLCAGPDALPQEVRGELDTARKRPSPKIRKKIAQLRQTMRTAFSR
ncbi:Hypothetical Protein FCC1311_033522 [Hondaea fermentalgiana]|uniref:Uncharacterized protein n=1 Tax=Hondaea fermentalgiana TaxID=2315210 RepID=A0A2R5GA07_9STRA|nr:Hypothetical Protein FCC1311_033522 [Hondaea fermentalgiana]|eukprot:GBG27129.1 Hypothetical Protein FCC1311_033522 [Hondaea fermentalgiana]